MSTTFVDNFMNAALTITSADRGMAVDGNLQIIATINLEQAELDDPSFSHCAQRALQKALNTGEAVITNNLVLDPAEAPKTNVNLTDLRFVVSIPIAGAGAVYLDQLVRPRGVITPQTIGSLMRLIAHIQDNCLEDCTPEEICALYEQVT